ncbi:MAG: hypothetical protein QG594_176 [Bacteroidota bacterium]|nr:hypothetical protein [Bacteroidota bacterium]
MKKIHYLLFIALGAIFFSSCTSTDDKVKTQDIYILVDNTEIIPESREGLISTESILKLMSSGGKVTWQKVNAVSLNSNKSIEFSLPEDATRFQKKQAVEPFVKEFENIREKFLGPEKKGTDNSSIYKPICEALQKLEKSKSSKKTLIIISDMIENSRFGNFYRDQDFKKLKARLDSSGVTLPETSNVKVVILYDPLGDSKNEKRFDRAMSYWKQLFDAAEIPYSVEPNL